MKRLIVLGTVLAVACGTVIFIISCGGGGSGGDGSGSADTAVLQRIALFADTNYVEYDPGNSDAEASNLEAALRAMGHTVLPFTGVGTEWSDPLRSGTSVLIVAELGSGHLGSDITTAAKDAVIGFVENGGTLFATLSEADDDWSLDFLNTTFGYSMAGTETLGGQEDLSYSSTEASGTGFEGAVPVTILANDATYLVDPGTVPTSGKIIYSSAAGNAALIYIPYGSGHIVISGYDWWNSKPVWPQDGGWWSVLYRSVTLNADHPSVLVYGADNRIDTFIDVPAKIRSSGHFSVVDTLRANSTVPTLAQLQAYDAVITWSDSDYADTMAVGDVLADYVDAGGGLVIGSLAQGHGDLTIGGRFAAEDYDLIAMLSGYENSDASLGTVNYPSHPTMAGVQTLDGHWRAAATSVAPPYTMIARWDDNKVLLATGEVNGTKRADLGLLPLSSDSLPTGWATSTDGATLMANALTWVADLPEPLYREVSSSVGMSNGGGCSVFSTLPATAMPESLSRVKVRIDITHTRTSDLYIELTSPTGTRVFLASGNGFGANFTDTIFDDWAATEITRGLNPFTGTYIPLVTLENFRGEDGNGTWSLDVSDDFCKTNGITTLNSWTLMVR